MGPPLYVPNFSKILSVFTNPSVAGLVTGYVAPLSSAAHVPRLHDGAQGGYAILVSFDTILFADLANFV